MEIKKISSKKQKALKIVVYILTIIAFINVCYYLGLFFLNWSHNYYTDHFLGPLALFLIAGITFITAYVNSHTQYSNNVKYDKYMYMLSILILAGSFVWLIGTYM